MSGSDDELEDIRERKLERLRRRAADASGDGGPAGGGSAGDGGPPGVERAPADGDGATDDWTDAARAEGTTPSEPVHVEGVDQLQELTADGVVLVDFYADWCGPCQMLEPVVADLAAETAATVAKVDIDDHRGLANRYQVQGVPTLYLFVDGEPAERLVGMQEPATLRSLIERHAGGA